MSEHPKSEIGRRERLWREANQPQAREEELKPCPFCGAPARVVFVGTEFYVRCSGQFVCYGSPVLMVGTHGFTYRADALAAWNRRAPTGGENVDTFQICECGDTDCVGEVEIHSPTQSVSPSAEQVDRSANTSADDGSGEDKGVPSAGLHPETEALVERFSAALKEKLRAAELKYGHGDSWRADDWEAKCRADLLAHVHKGDSRDVAAYAAFCWAHGWSTAPPAGHWRDLSQRLVAHTAQAERIKALERREAVSDKAFSRVNAQVAALTAERDALRDLALDVQVRLQALEPYRTPQITAGVLTSLLTAVTDALAALIQEPKQ